MAYPLIANAATRCFTGTVAETVVNQRGATSISAQDCDRLSDPDYPKDTCYREWVFGNFVMGCELNDECNTRKNNNGNDTVCCWGDLCNAPEPIHANKDAIGMSLVRADMISIMYTVMGSILGILWLVFAFIAPMLPAFLLLVFGIIDAVFAYFLIFIPVTHFLGLFFMALGAITVSTHHFKDSGTLKFVAFGAVVGFLLISGLTFVPGYTNDISGHASFLDFFDPNACVTSLSLNRFPDKYLYGFPTRCENYLLFVVFCVYLLLLIQPFVVILAWKAASKSESKSD